MLFNFEGTNLNIWKSGGNSKEDTPVPIPNTVVKLFSAEDTWRVTSWEIRTSPVFLIYGAMVKRLRHHPFTVVSRVRFPVASPQKYARLAELADALDLGSSGRPWGFKSLVAHQKVLENSRTFYFACTICVPFFYYISRRKKMNLPEGFDEVCKNI